MSRGRDRLVVVAFLCVGAGAALHWPDFVMAASMRFRLVGMPMSPPMLAGMALILLGLGLAAYALVRPAAPVEPEPVAAARIDDERSLAAGDVAVLALMTVALVIDVMKPATISFVIPGMRVEYGITTGQAALLPLFALTGTVVGSLAWGLLGDRIGRRGGLLLAALLFIGTSICGAMPQFVFNLAMCFAMGMSAGGMLPLVLALVAEIVPRRSRAALTVLIAGLGGTGGYLAASSAAAILAPAFSWRVLWLIGLPTGLLLALFARYIPESPRFLLLVGRREDARRALLRYGDALAQEPGAVEDERSGRVPLLALFRSPYASQTIPLALFGLAWGLANFGFLTWLPSLLQQRPGLWNGLLARAALVALPGALLTMWLYGRWRTRVSIGVFALGTSVAILLLGLLLTRTQDRLLLGALITLILVGINGSSAMFTVYAAEIYPTLARATGTGLVAAAGKLGGLVGPQVVALSLILGGGAIAAAWLVAAPLSAAGLVMWRAAVETSGRSLQEIQATVAGSGE